MLASLLALTLPAGPVVIDPARLGMVLRTGRDEVVLAAPGPASEVADVVTTPTEARWRLPARGLAVAARVDGDRLRVRFDATKPQALAWPRTGPAALDATLALPNGGGLVVGARDAFWRGKLAGAELDASGGLTFPAWGWSTGPTAVAYVLADELRTTLALADAGGRLVAEARHDFRARDAVPVDGAANAGEPPAPMPAYEVLIAPGPADPLAAPRAYRRHLEEAGRFVPFAAKLKASPDAARLLGASHAYLWGDGRKRAILDRLEALGVDRMWLGFDQDARADRFVVDAAFARAAKARGHLIGPYLTLENVQDPATADTPQSVFDRRLFETGAVRKSDGQPRGGFAGRGHELSSEALRRERRDWIGERLADARRLGANAPFLDVDAFGELHDDFDPAHPMTTARDRENRLGRMRRLGREAGLVLGSETGVGWAVPALHFAHGAHTVLGDDLWGLVGQAGKAGFGGWGPPPRPAIFFKEATLKADVARALYDPTARVPLYQAVFHDALVSTDRWEFSPVKIPALRRERQLLELLYLQPAVWNLDLALLRTHGQRLARLHAFFAPLHRAFGVARLEAFAWLTPDRRVQRTRFAGGLVMTANFGARPAHGVPPLAIEARWPDGRRQVFRPD